MCLVKTGTSRSCSDTDLRACNPPKHVLRHRPFRRGLSSTSAFVCVFGMFTQHFACPAAAAARPPHPPSLLPLRRSTHVLLVLRRSIRASPFLLFFASPSLPSGLFPPPHSAATRSLASRCNGSPPTLPLDAWWAVEAAVAAVKVKGRRDSGSPRKAARPRGSHRRPGDRPCGMCPHARPPGCQRGGGIRS